MELYKDPSRPVAERVEDLLARMTLEEKPPSSAATSPPPSSWTAR